MFTEEDFEKLLADEEDFKVRIILKPIILITIIFNLLIICL